MDAVDRTLLAALQENARISTKDLASKVRLSAPATAERLRKLQEAGVIEAFTALLDTKALGYHIDHNGCLASLRGIVGGGCRVPAR